MCWHLPAVKRYQIEVCSEAPDSHRGAFASLTVDRDPRDALQRLCEVGIGEVTDILSGNSIYHALGVSLGVHSTLQARTDAFNNDFFNDRLVVNF